jgi:6-phosphogluconate dehydrogenase
MIPQDGGNEWYLNTERRQKALEKVGVRYIGIGVGPCVSPSAASS